jgi:hypothetical protein
MGTATERIDKHRLGANGNNIPGVHALLPANLKRRTLSVAAAVVLPALMTSAVLALAGPAQAGPADRAGTGRVSMAITSMNPQYAGPGAIVTVAGTISNGTGQAQTGLNVQLYTSPTGFSTRDGMDSFLTQGGNNDNLEPAGNPFLISASVNPGATVSWRASFGVSSVGMSEFGVYPVAAQLGDSAGNVLTSAQTLLPFWPGQRAAGLLSPLDISWLWPLVDQPHHQVCPALTNNDLTASLNPGGRLADLVAAGTSYPDADVTWVIDPALLSDVATMTSRHQVGGKPNCTGAPFSPASRAAARWLSAVKTATASQPTLLTPYANVDMTALVHQGLNADLASAYAAGDTVAGGILGRTFTPTIAWPPGGTADLSVLTSLATTEGIGTVVLNSGEMPPAGTAVYEPDDAVSSITTGAGTSMHVLLADDTLTGVLKAADTSSGALPASTGFAVRQRFLAETAMIAAEAPDSDRSVVVAPPEDWSPPQALASELLSETVNAPWLEPATLNSLTTAPNSYRKLPRQAPPASQESPGELSRGYLSEVKTAGAQLSVFESMLYRPPSSYLPSLNEALSAAESAAWRGSGDAQGLALARSLLQYVSNAERKVKIIASAQVPMGGASGKVPVSIENGLLDQAIAVRVNASVVNTPNGTSQLTIGRFDNLVVVPPGDAPLVRLPVSSAPQGSTVIQLSLTSADGKPLPFATASLTVVSTRYGRAILFLIGAAIGVLVLTSGYRGVRRRLGHDPHVVNEEADLPGSVVTGTSARHPTEAPDDLADARRWADDA